MSSVSSTVSIEWLVTDSSSTVYSALAFQVKGNDSILLICFPEMYTLTQGSVIQNQISDLLLHNHLKTGLLLNQLMSHCFVISALGVVSPVQLFN